MNAKKRESIDNLPNERFKCTIRHRFWPELTAVSDPNPQYLCKPNGSARALSVDVDFVCRLVCSAAQLQLCQPQPGASTQLHQPDQNTNCPTCCQAFSWTRPDQAQSPQETFASEFWSSRVESADPAPPSQIHWGAARRRGHWWSPLDSIWRRYAGQYQTQNRIGIGSEANFSS